jgi:UDP:flavonoid glycosyltransferase YjiC (YdhE family)
VRILFATTRGAGHLGPLIPFAKACRRAGHEVLVAAPGSVAPHVERAGLPLAPLEDPDEQAIQPIWQRVRAARPGEADQIVLEEIFAGEFARSALPGMLATMRAWRPDVVLRESTEFASLVAAEQLGVPHLHVAVFLAAGGEFDWALLADPIERLRSDAGLSRGGGSAPFWQEPYVTLAPRSLEAPSAAPPPGTRRYREPVAPARPLPDWWEGSHEPLVYVSFGSAAAGNGFYPGLYREALEALDGLPARVLLTLGTEVDPAELRATPSSVHVEPWVPQNDVMAHADAMVGHGGSGSTLMAMAAGMPLAVVPLFADQPQNARRVAALGAGLALGHRADADDATPVDSGMEAGRLDGLRDAVTSLLTDPRYRAAAGAVAAEIAAQPPVEAVVGVLEEIVRGEALAA